MMEKTFDKTALIKELKIDARGIGIPDGSSKIFIEQVVLSVEKKLAKKSLITNSDLKRLIIKELKKYNHDFAYVYENRDKIV